MKKILLSLVLILLAAYSVFAQDWVWIRQFSSTGNVTPVDIVYGNDGNIYVAGLYTQQLTIGTTTLPYSGPDPRVDIFLCSFASNGTFRWARQIGGNHLDDVGGIAVDNNNNIYISGSYRSTTLSFPPSPTTLANVNHYDAFLAKYDNNGNLIFANRIFWGTDPQRLTDVAVDFTNNRLVLIGFFKTQLIYFDGTSNQTITTPDPKEHFIALYNLDGGFINIKTIKGSQEPAVFKTVNNCVYGGNVQGYFVTGDLVGKLYLPGNDTLKGDEVLMDAMVIRFDTNLDYMWARRGGGTSWDHVNSAARDENGNIYMAGKCQSNPITFDSTSTLQSAPLPNLGVGGWDYYLAKYNRNGYLQWLKRKGGPGQDNAYGLSVKKSRVVTTGNIDNSGNINTGFDLYDVNGNFIIGDVITGNLEDQGQGVAFNSSADSIFMTGYFKSNILYAGPLTLTNTVAGLQDGFLVKYGYKFKIYLEEKINITCNGSNNGYIKVGTQFGIEPITYAWTPNVSTSFEASGLTAQTYKIVTTDGSGKRDSVNVTITEPAAITIATTLLKDVTCFEGEDGEIRVTVTGGTPPYTLTWSGPDNLVQDNPIQTGLVAGTYKLVVKDKNECTTEKTFDVNQPSKVTFTGSNVGMITVPPSCNGAVNLVVSGGTPGYTYNWSGPSGYSSTNGTITSLCLGGDYNLEVKDSKLCLQDTTFNVPCDTMLNITIDSVRNVKCKGDCNGYARVSVTFGGTGSYSYAWRNSMGNPVGGNNPVLPDVCTGTYYVKVTDLGNGKTAETSASVGEPAIPLTLSFTTVRDISCYGKNDGFIDLNPRFGWGRYTYEWLPRGDTTQDVSNLTENTWTVFVTDAGGCVEQLSTTVNEPSEIIVNSISVFDSISCQGDADGSLWAHVTGGTKPYSYIWDDDGFQNDSIATDLYARLYSVNVIDSKGCKALKTSKNLTEPLELTIGYSKTNVECMGDSTGSITLSPNGGTSPYTYSWDDGPVAKDRSGLPAGTYCVTVNDYHGCTGYQCITITEPANKISIDKVITHVECNSGNNGAIDITSSGGTPGYIYSWAHGPATEDVTGLSVGNYTVTVTDANGCAQDSTFKVNEPTAIIIDRVITDVTCNGGSNGAIDITVSGGTPVYTYSWSHGPATEDVTNLAAGDYTVTVTDANGCTLDSTFIINEPPAIVIDRVITDVSCIGLCDGAIDITISGGTPVYTYSWSQGPITEDVSGLCTGDYTITVADANGCTLDSTFTVSEPSAIVIDRVITNVSCKSGSDGAINITLSGGTFPYTYSWSHGPTTEDVSGLTAGDYTITVTDANGCTLDSTFTVSEPAATISIDTEIKTDITCAGKTDGSVTVIASGGTGTLIYTISPGDSSNITGTFINLPPDSYTVSITDGNGCGPVLSNSLVVGTGTYSLSIDNVTVTDISCQGDTNGTVNISVSGGLQPYIYMWSNSETTEDINNLPAGVYSVTVTDANACQVDSADIPVGEPAAIIITLIDSADVSCYGLTDGSINITASGGTGNLVFSKDGGLNYEDNGGIFPGLAAGVYDLFIKDDNSCELNAGTATVSEPEVLTIGSEDMTNITCYGDADGSITVTATGGNSPYTYTLNPGAIETNSTGIFPNLGPGSYTVSVEDNNLCGPVTSGSIEISEPDAITVLDTSITYPIPDFVEGAISIDSISGGISPYTFTLNPGNVSNSTGEFVIQEGGEYTITITDDNGCEKDIDVDLIEGKSAITIFNAFTPNGDGYNEVWNIINIGLYPGNTVRIYNSWGNLVFSSDGYEEPWDGTYNGRVLPADTYYYVIDLGDGSDPYTGSVSIIK